MIWRTFPSPSSKSTGLISASTTASILTSEVARFIRHVAIWSLLMVLFRSWVRVKVVAHARLDSKVEYKPTFAVTFLRCLAQAPPLLELGSFPTIEFNHQFCLCILVKYAIAIYPEYSTSMYTSPLFIFLLLFISSSPSPFILLLPMFYSCILNSSRT